MANGKKKLIRKSNIIKWYEYSMDYGDKKEETIEETEISDELISEDPDEEEIRRKMAELNDDDQALVADIMARFADAKQNVVDGLFEGDSESAAIQETVSGSGESEDDLISQICAPKQTNVDDFINMAREGM